jgi:hypothetical protein
VWPLPAYKKNVRSRNCFRLYSAFAAGEIAQTQLKKRLAAVVPLPRIYRHRYFGC